MKLPKYVVLTVVFLAAGYMADAQGQNYLRDTTERAPAPVLASPAPVKVVPARVEQPAEPEMAVEPAPVEVEAAPVAVEPAPMAMEPAPVERTVEVATSVPPPAEHALPAAEMTSAAGGSMAWETVKEQLAAAADWLSGRLEIGTRITHFILLESERGDGKGGGESFVGQIHFLEEDQDYMPTKLFADYMFTPRFGLELTWDEFRADTKNDNGGSTDGAAILSGPMLSAIWRFPTDSIFTPYAGLGVALLNGDFDHREEWHIEGNTRRTIYVDDVVAFPVSAGCAIEIKEHLSGDVYLRYIHANPDARFEKTIHSRHTSKLLEDFDGDFDLSNITIGLGVKYVF